MAKPNTNTPDLLGFTSVQPNLQLIASVHCDQYWMFVDKRRTACSSASLPLIPQLIACVDKVIEFNNIDQGDLLIPKLLPVFTRRSNPITRIKASALGRAGMKGDG